MIPKTGPYIYPGLPFSEKMMEVIQIRNIVCEFYGISVAKFMSVKNSKNCRVPDIVSKIRRMVIYLTKFEIKSHLSLEDIGKVIGMKTRSAVSMAVKHSIELWQYNHEFKSNMILINKLLNENEQNPN